jgi:tetratricopeptide (TPR) repeat protein
MVEIDYGAEFHRALNESAALLVQNRPGEAVERLLPLLEIAPEHPDVLINLSGAYILQRKWNKAVALLTRAVQRIDDNAMLWMNLGAAQLGRLETAGPRQQERAIQAYQRALEVDSEAPNAHYHLGLIYEKRGEFNRACALFQRALEVNPADRDARYWLDRVGRLLMEAQTEAQQDTGADDTDSPHSDTSDTSDIDVSAAGADTERNGGAA